MEFPLLIPESAFRGERFDGQIACGSQVASSAVTLG